MYKCAGEGRINPALEWGKEGTKLQRSGNQSINNYGVEGLFRYLCRMGMSNHFGW
jgi:hypothetical protein